MSRRHKFIMKTNRKVMFTYLTDSFLWESGTDTFYAREHMLFAEIPQHIKDLRYPFPSHGKKFILKNPKSGESRSFFPIEETHEYWLYESKNDSYDFSPKFKAKIYKSFPVKSKSKLFKGKKFVSKF